MVTANTPIRYQDLIDGFSARILELGDNIGSFDSSVPAALRSPYTTTVTISVENGHTPRVVWTNISTLTTVPQDTVTSQFNAYCNTWLLNNNAYANQVVMTATVLKFITAIFAFIQCKFVTVYSPLTTVTAVFYMSSNTVNTSYIYNNPSFTVDLNNVNDLINAVCNSAVNSTKGICALSGYSLLRQ